MAARATARAIQAFPKLKSSKNLTLALDLPSPPVRTWPGIPGITIHTGKGDIEFRSSKWGGRLLGIQIKTGPADYQTILRVDYWNFQSGPLGNLEVHYHVANESAGNKHPAGQKIWP